MEDHIPKVASYTPPWLLRPSPGFDLFSNNLPNTFSSPDETAIPSPRRTIANRGTEVFVALGKELRWTDLRNLQDDWDEEENYRAHRRSRGRSTRSQSIGNRTGYRVLRTPVKDEIRQLIISHNDSLMAILTATAVYVAVLPNASLLRSQETAPIKLRVYSIGPNATTSSQSQVMSAIWHPFGLFGNCLVTVTVDAVVRLWELQPENRGSFSSPALTIDLKKLVDGTSAAEDFSAAMVGKDQTFSPDSFEMEVAAACFGGTGGPEENGWAAMTLWIAMREGDVYALCPLLPSKWQPSLTTIPSLSISSVANLVAVQDDPSITEDVKRCYTYQMEWMRDIDEQDPTVIETTSGEAIESHNRPAKPSPIPQLQGPFEFYGESEELRGDVELITDIHICPGKAQSADEEADEDGMEAGQSPESLSVGIVFLLTNTGRVRVCLDTQGVSARWLPAKKTKKTQPVEESEPPSLLVYEYINTMEDSALPSVSDLIWPLFTPSPFSRSSFFITHPFGVTYMSADPWLPTLERELGTADDAGQDFRLDIIMNSPPSSCTRILAFPQETVDEEDPPPASLAIVDPALGSILLTTLPSEPTAAIFAPQSPPPSPSSPRSPSLSYKSPTPATRLQSSTPAPPARPIYTPSRAFYAGNPLPSLFASHISQNRNLQAAARGNIRLSPATLELMTESHRVLSTHTHVVGVGAAELFRRCGRLAGEFELQIVKVRDIADRIDGVILASDEGMEVGRERGSARDRVAERLQTAVERQDLLERRVKELRRKVGRVVGTKEMGENEKKWVEEIGKMASQVMVAPEKSTEEKVKMPRMQEQIWFRFPEAGSLYTELIRLAREITTAETSKDSPAPATPETPQTPPSRRGSAAGVPQSAGKPGIRIPLDIRKAKIEQVMAMLERETALVEATKARLERLAIV
ncbi:MAG: hypothetical protein M1814_006764 [Vezdaea aestivalis]|nr:MAG: hypothetical protein M1814_006764 [Vezdaea aestivalis]